MLGYVRDVSKLLNTLCATHCVLHIVCYTLCVNDIVSACVSGFGRFSERCIVEQRSTCDKLLDENGLSKTAKTLPLSTLNHPDVIV